MSKNITCIIPCHSNTGGFSLTKKVVLPFYKVLFKSIYFVLPLKLALGYELSREIIKNFFGKQTSGNVGPDQLLAKFKFRDKEDTGWTPLA